MHYFEDGNVQLVASKPAELTLEIASQSLSIARGESDGQVDDIAKAIGVAIKKHEQAYHQNLNDANNELSERAFKAIRRQLPVTKQKLDWEKVSVCHAWKAYVIDIPPIRLSLTNWLRSCRDRSILSL